MDILYHFVAFIMFIYMDIYTHVYCNVTVTRPAMFDPSALLDIKHRETSFSAGGKYV